MFKFCDKDGLWYWCRLCGVLFRMYVFCSWTKLFTLTMPPTRTGEFFGQRLTKCWCVTCHGLTAHAIQGEVATLLAMSCYGNRIRAGSVGRFGLFIFRVYAHEIHPNFTCALPFEYPFLILFIPTYLKESHRNIRFGKDQKYHCQECTKTTVPYRWANVT